jgi:hypothetical protein
MELSFGELIDKRAILRVKYNRLTNKADLKMVGQQLVFIDKYLFKAIDYYIDKDLQPHLRELMYDLETNHYRQWDYEDQVFAAEDVVVGVTAPKNSRTMNTIRAKIKREIDLMFNEKFLEAKDYAKRQDLE